MHTAQSEATTTTGQTSDLAKIEETKIDLKSMLGKRFILKTPEGDISEQGVESIQWSLRQAGHPELPEDFDWKWATNRGTLPKRIQAFFYKQHQLKLSAELISELGNVGKQHASNGAMVVLDFTETIDWQDGDFGDGGSCFWGERNGAREMIEDNGFAVRVYRARAGYDLTTETGEPSRGKICGYGRAWVAEVGENSLVVFNGYGESTLTFARWLALKFNCSYQRISLTNNGLDDGALWINGAVGFLVGAHSHVSAFKSLDLAWPEIKESRYTCEVCDERVEDDNAYQAYTERGRQITACGDCCATCDHCGEHYAYTLKRFEREELCGECHGDKVRAAIREAQSDRKDICSRIDDLKEQLEEAEGQLEDIDVKIEDLEAEVEA